MCGPPIFVSWNLHPGDVLPSRQRGEDPDEVPPVGHPHLQSHEFALAQYASKSIFNYRVLKYMEKSFVPTAPNSVTISHASERIYTQGSVDFYAFWGVPWMPKLYWGPVTFCLGYHGFYEVA